MALDTNCRILVILRSSKNKSEMWVGMLEKNLDGIMDECDDEVELTNEEFFDPDVENLIDKDEVAEIFRIEIDIFDFETPICMAFDEFKYLLKIDTDLLTSDILRFKTYDEFKNKWMDKWNKGIP
ncbi:hypothetical protein Tco_0859557 [Tanacetum coccineum]|uniref:Uncharacterized protein n=1 Tax=Tanacetum coccineum TaxID=301880 RepID=A0ABQ5BCF1_9ASTR